MEPPLRERSELSKGTPPSVLEFMESPSLEVRPEETSSTAVWAPVFDDEDNRSALTSFAPVCINVSFVRRLAAVTFCTSAGVASSAGVGIT